MQSTLEDAGTGVDAGLEQPGDALAVKGRVTEEQRVEMGTLQIEVQVVLPGEPDAAVHLQRRVHDAHAGVARPRLGRRSGERSVVSTGTDRPGGVPNRRTHALDV